MGSLSITIQDWAAWVPGISDRSEWEEWYQGSRAIDMGSSPSLVQIPPMLRRRLSNVGKMALSVAWSLIPSNDTKLPAVFASRHGELERTVKMLKTLADVKEGEAPQLSPTQFSLSVHNAISGVYSIARKDVNAISALAVGVDGLNLALMEAELIRQEQGADAILCVIYDEPLSEPFSPQDAGPEIPYSMALKIVKSNDQSKNNISLKLDLNEKLLPDDEGANPQALSFIRFLLNSESQSLDLSGQHHDWRWSKTLDQIPSASA